LKITRLAQPYTPANVSAAGSRSALWGSRPFDEYQLQWTIALVHCSWYSSNGLDGAI